MTYMLFCRPVNHLSDEFIRQTFSEFGRVTDIHTPRSYKTKKRQGFCYVKFSDKHAAARAIDALHGRPLNGHVMEVVWADNNPKTPEQMIELKKKRREERLRQMDANLDDDMREGYKPMKDLPFHEQFFTAVDYPPGVGVDFTPIYQRNLPPVGKRRLFFSWVYIPESVRQRIIDEEARKNADA